MGVVFVSIGGYDEIGDVNLMVFEVGRKIF